MDLKVIVNIVEEAMLVLMQMLVAAIKSNLLQKHISLNI